MPRPPRDVAAEMNAFPFWYHRIDLGGGLVTPGWAPIHAAAYRIPADLTGKRVLDVGAWDGYWSFEALRRGAREVVAIDDFSDRLGLLEEGARDGGWETFDFCREVLGHDPERCQRHEMSLHDLTPETFGVFDVVFFFGTLYHLRYPLLALDTLSRVCSETIHVESAICDDFSPYQGGLGHGYRGGRHVVMEFYPTTEYGDNSTNWWAPTLACLGQLLAASGFARVDVWKLLDAPEHLPHCRGFARGVKAPAASPG